MEKERRDMEQRIGCIVMAAGLASRYGANKLLETEQNNIEQMKPFL